jgi:hypothetical protein
VRPAKNAFGTNAADAGIKGMLASMFIDDLAEKTNRGQI